MHAATGSMPATSALMGMASGHTVDRFFVFLGISTAVHYSVFHPIYRFTTAI